MSRQIRACSIRRAEHADLVHRQIIMILSPSAGKGRRNAFASPTARPSGALYETRSEAEIGMKRVKVCTSNWGRDRRYPSSYFGRCPPSSWWAAVSVWSFTFTNCEET